MSALDSSLDSIIASKKGSARRNQQPKAKPAAPRQQQAPQQQQQQQQPQFVGVKIVVSNLPEDVTEAQIKELFTSTVGPLRSASLAYDSKGKSKGVATIEFHKAQDASKAYDQYNKRLVDGKRPMKVEIIVDPSRAVSTNLSARLGAAPGRASATVSAASGNTARQPRQAGTGGRRGGKVAGGRAREPERPKATIESLDAEMSDYQAGNKAE